MQFHFYKMQGTGNDYVYIDATKRPVPNPAVLARTVSDRHFGIGSDGLILLLPSTVADVRMQMFNADGSEGKMCGNGIRCVGKLAYDLGICRSASMMVETLSGIKSLKLQVQSGEVQSVCVDMGGPAMEIEKVPVRYSERRMVNVPLTVGGVEYHITCVSMGNPHAVTFQDDVDSLDLPAIGPLFEHHEIFPESVNTEFVQVVDKRHLKMRVWERGSGETLACGTGACASVVAACLAGHCPRGEDVDVALRGGVLTILWDNDRVWMTGPAKLVFTGDIEIAEDY